MVVTTISKYAALSNHCTCSFSSRRRRPSSWSIPFLKLFRRAGDVDKVVSEADECLKLIESLMSWPVARVPSCLSSFICSSVDGGSQSVVLRVFL
jgi:hypothetical protein